MTVTVHLSNRIETLRDMALSVLSLPMPDALATEYVLVDNKVMGQWFNLQFAQHSGIAANMRAIQPHELFWLLARAVVSSDIPKETPLSKLEMTWKLYGLLGDKKTLQQPVMKPVLNYLQGEASYALKRYQLSASIADLFDQYLIYRPVMMLDWEQGKSEKNEDANAAWQRALWCAIAKGQQHRAAIEKSLLAALDKEDSTNIQAAIPLQRLSVFGVTSMPPLLVDMLMLLGKHIPVDLFVFNPCREYWFDIQSAKTLAKNPKKRALSDGVIGNPLLASQGQQVREFIESLYARHDQHEFHEAESYIDFDKATLLQCIQQEIVDLQYQGGVALRGAMTSAAVKQMIPAIEGKNAVRSLQIHSCHSPLREVEVLHDQLLALFKQDPTLKPRDVVVMMPQVAPYVPYIDTVFGATSHALPYHIADRSWLEEVPLLNALNLLFGLPNSRLPLTDILALLEVSAIQARFNIDRDGFEKLKNWLRDSGVRWGIDAKHREQEGLPAYSEFSWEFAINRLLSGYGMSAGDAPLELANNSLAVMPFDEVEGGSAELLNNFLTFWDALLRFKEELSTSASIRKWCDRIGALLDAFINPQSDEEKLALRGIRREIYALNKAQTWCEELIDIAVVRALIQPSLQAPAQGGHPWREGVKFCSLMPMRGVPFRVVYILGMNQSDYPKRSTQSSFDLMRKNYQAGDRSRRVDDRWLFLEALLSARDVFHVSYIGRDQRKNEERQPSVVLAELMDYLRNGYCLPKIDDADGKQLMQQLIMEHPLQPFSAAYFHNKQTHLPPSFNQQAFSIASHKTKERRASASVNAWVKSKKPEDPVLEVSLESFVRFFTNPAQWYFRDRCNKVSLRMRDESVSDTEILHLNDSLDAWAVKDALLQLAETVENQADEAFEQRIDALFNRLIKNWEAEAKWPLGSGSDSLCNKIKEQITEHWLDARKLVQGEAVTYAGEHTIVTKQGSLLIRGELPCIGDTFFFHTASKQNDAKAFQLAMQSAFAAMAMPSVKRSVAVFWEEGKPVQGEPLKIDKANEKFLKTLAALYLQYREYGLPFLPSVSLQYKEEYQDSDRDKWELNIGKAWNGDSYVGGSAGLVGDIQSVAFYMSEQRLLDEDFLKTASTVTNAWKQWKEAEVQA